MNEIRRAPTPVINYLLSHLPLDSASRSPDAIALRTRNEQWSYADLGQLIERVAHGLCGIGLKKQERVAIYLPKRIETVASCFGTSRAGGIFVPVNPLLKAPQVGHILRDSGASVLVTSPDRLGDLAHEVAQAGSLRHIVLTGTDSVPERTAASIESMRWQDLTEGSTARLNRIIDRDVVSILYTSGSTGRPKGVVLSHANMVTGARSVAEYLENRPEDRLLAVLPFSFDYGFSQLTTAFLVGASVTLIDHLFARDVVAAVERDRITGLAAVPPLWIQLADLAWPSGITEHLRYFTNSGGRMPRATLDKLRAALPGTRPFLMYGLTEAFRGTYLPPDQLDRRPDSMGKAIPNAEILVVRPDGSACAPDEPGELVQRGSLVALGYWNDPEKTAERFKPVPSQRGELPLTEMAVWSGDTVRMDDEGFLYFVGRRDEMIKSSGYRISPTEVEEIVYASGRVSDAVAVAAPHPGLGEAIVLVAAPPSLADPAAGAAWDQSAATTALMDHCRAQMPAYMVPARIEWLDVLPRNPNGKFDRPAIASKYRSTFEGTA
jgi:acyl-CoA ligase (AMP-forming) (exosortase A-associated)